MYDFLQKFHSGWAYITVLLGLVLFVLALVFFLNKKEKSKIIQKLSFYTTLTFHIQFVVGIVLYLFFSPNGIESGSTFYKFEHPSMMFAAVLFVTIANAKIKRSTTIKLPVVLLSFLAILLVFLMIPGTHVFGFIQNMIR